MVPKKELEMLQPLHPFFRQYTSTFVQHFLQNYKDHYQIGAGPNAKAAVSHLFVRHFIPGLKESQFPVIKENIQEIYDQMLQERHIISITVLGMMKDLMLFQNDLNSRQLASFQTFIAVNLPNEAPTRGPRAVQTEPPAEKESLASPIMNFLEQIRDEKLEITCFNLYKNVPVTFSATVDEVIPTKKLASFKLHPTQAAAVAIAKEIWLKSDVLPGTVRATLNTIDLTRGIGVFSRFQLTNLREASRETVRVEPAEKISVALHHADGSVSGQLMDISLAGMGVRLQKNTLKVDSEVTIMMTLSPGGNITAQGTIAGASPRGSGVALGIRLYPNQQSHDAISDYINQRQREIVAELQDQR